MNNPGWSSLMALVFVIALIPIVLWLVKAARQTRPGTRGPLTLRHRLALGPREQIAIVRAGTKTLLVGITAQSIQTLCELSAEDLADLPAENDAQLHAGFQSILKRLTRP